MTPMLLNLNFLGRFQKLNVPKAQSMRAVFEAVANSFDATNYLLDKGKIVVRVISKVANNLQKGTKEEDYELAGFEIEDNGEGFTDKNMLSFKDCDSTSKPGGKGIGRLLWLHVFNRVEIESTYRQGDTWQKRAFPFSVQEIGKNDDNLAPSSVIADQPTSNKTVVRLLDPKNDRLPHLSIKHETVAARLLDHFLLRFADTRGQSLDIVDDLTGATVSVGEMFEKTLQARYKSEPINMNGLEFVLHHLFVKPASSKNQIRFCANQRVVSFENENISAVAPDVSPNDSVTTDGFRYHAYVTGLFLDKICDEDRMRLKFPRELPTDDEQPESLNISDAPIDEVTKKELIEAIGPKVREHLADHLEGVRARKEATLVEFAIKQPQFRPYVEVARTRLDRLKAKPSPRETELLYCEAKIDGREAMDKIVNDIVSRNDAINKVAEYRDVLLKQFTAEHNRYNQSSLIEYVCARKAVIQVLAAFQKKANGVNEFEKAIHDLVFPKGATSDEMPVGPSDDRKLDKENLWLIDERLAFHRVLHSDKPLDGMGAFRTNSPQGQGKKPDITVFDPALTTCEGDDLQSIAIVEFKRPGRTDYKDTDNPIRQLIDAAQEIRDGNILTLDGELKSVRKEVLIFGFGICDFTAQVVSFARLFDMKKTIDGLGYQKYHEETNMIMELMTYQKLISEAERRNAAFFKRLGM
jgi:hypothetical protein